jgi:hypothetical protein
MRYLHKRDRPLRLTYAPQTSATEAGVLVREPVGEHSFTHVEVGSDRRKRPLKPSVHVRSLCVGNLEDAQEIAGRHCPSVLLGPEERRSYDEL